MPDEQWQFAVLVTTRLGDAPLRNRHKRWARECFRRQRQRLPQPGRLILRFQQPATSYQQVEQAFLDAYDKAFRHSRQIDRNLPEQL